MRPETRYTHSEDVSIAYQIVGDGPIDLVIAPGWIFHLEAVWEEPSWERFMRRLTPHFRVIAFDKRGTGLSDRTVGVSTFEERMDDVRAVMDAAGSQSAAILGWSEGALIGGMFAATYPERTRALIAYSGLARTLQGDDFPEGYPVETVEGLIGYLRQDWGSGISAYLAVPSRADDAEFRKWFGRYERMSLSPSEAVNLARINMALDARYMLSTIRVPTLVLHQRDDRFVAVELGRDLASRIPGAKFVELPGTDHLFWFSDPEDTVSEIIEFVTGTRPEPDVDRVLATVMFADIVGSTERAAQIGDHKWRSLLDRYYSLADDEIDRFRGRKIKTLGDGVLATFDGPARAVRCAQALARRAPAIGLEVRSGVHTGEIELIGDDVGGIAVHISSRVIGHAGAGEVVCSSTVKDLVAGSGIAFEDRGAHPLKGVPGKWHLFAARN